MVPNFNRHADDEQIERYSTGTMPVGETADFEEHLLVCESCRKRLTVADDYIATVKAVSGKCEESRPIPHWTARWRWTFAVAVAAAGIILAVRLMPLWPGSAPVVVELEVSRGAAAAEAPAHTAVRLRPDLTGLPVHDRYLVEVVDENGKARWQGQTSRTEFPLVPGLNSGTYFVRTYSPAKELLREYVLNIGR